MSDILPIPHEPPYRLGIDLGGTKIECAILKGAAVIHRQRVETPQGDYLATLARIESLVRSAWSLTGYTLPVGIGIPGSVSPDHGRIKNANSVCLIGQDLAGDLQGRLGQPVRLANDADCFALSEATDGAGRGACTVFGAILGTGCGAGIVVRGALLAGPNAIAGEWGHNPLPGYSAADGPPRRCYCGRFNCLETFLSGPGLSETHRQLTGESLSARDMASQHFNAPTTTGADTLDAYTDHLARGLASVINILDPHVIVLGGGVSNIRPLYNDVPRRWAAYVFSDKVNTQLKPAIHGDSSGVRGAAWLWNGTT